MHLQLLLPRLGHFVFFTFLIFTSYAEDQISGRKPKFYMMGNSVMRHYAFALSSFMLNQSQSITTSIITDDKDLCGSAKTTANRCSFENDIIFLWKLALPNASSSGGDNRDFCMSKADLDTQMDLEGCLRAEFVKASTSDVLMTNAL